MCADPTLLVKRLVYWNRLCLHYPSLSSFPYLLNDKSELSPLFVNMETSVSSPSLRGVWQGPYPCDYLIRDTTNKIAMVMHGDFDLDARETTLRGARLLATMRPKPPLVMASFFGVIVNPKWLLAVFIWPTNTYGQPELLADHIAKRVRLYRLFCCIVIALSVFLLSLAAILTFTMQNKVKLPNAEEVAKRLEIADTLLAAKKLTSIDNRYWPFELCFVAQRQEQLVFMPSLEVLTKCDTEIPPRGTAETESPPVTTERIADLIKVVFLCLLVHLKVR